MLRKSIIINQRKRKNQPTATITSKEHSIVFFVKIKQKRSTGKRLSICLVCFFSVLSGSISETNNSGSGSNWIRNHNTGYYCEEGTASQFKLDYLTREGGS